MNLRYLVSQYMQKFWEKHVFLATVTGTSGNKVTIKPSGDGSAIGSFAKLAAYAAPVNGDEVLVIKVGGNYLVCGKISR